MEHDTVGWTRRMSEVEYSVEESSRTVKKKTLKSRDDNDGETPQMTVSLPRAMSLSAFGRGHTFKAAVENVEGLHKRSSIQGTTRIDFAGSQVDSQTRENEVRLFSSRANDSRHLLETSTNIFELVGKNSTQQRKFESIDVHYKSQVMTRSKSILKLGMNHSNRSLPKRSATIDGRCPISLASKRSSLVKLDQHRGDQDIPYLLNHLGLLDSVSSKSILSLKKVTLASLQRSWFGPKRTGASRTLDVEPKVRSFNPFYQDKMSLGQYTLEKLNKEQYTGSQGYKRVNFLSSRLDGTILTTES